MNEDYFNSVNKLTADINFNHLTTLIQLYASERIHTSNNGGTDSISGFIGWYIDMANRMWKFQEEYKKNNDLKDKSI